MLKPAPITGAGLVAQDRCAVYFRPNLNTISEPSLRVMV